MKRAGYLDIYLYQAEKLGRGTFPVLVESVFKRYRYPTTMEYSARHIIQDALSHLVTSAHSEVDISKLLWYIGVSRSAGIASAR